MVKYTSPRAVPRKKSSMTIRYSYVYDGTDPWNTYCLFELLWRKPPSLGACMDRSNVEDLLEE